MIYLCLDLSHVIDPSSATALSGLSVIEVLTHPWVNSSTWARTWRCFPDRSAALQHQAENPTLIVIPLAPADVVSIEEMP